MLLKNIVGGTLLAATGVVAKPIYQRSVAFSYGSSGTPIRGVNIGGWLVLEPWITPSIFQSLDQSLGIVDEWTLTEKLGSDAALAILKPHWDSWCTMADFQKIANAGFNMVRIPVGYWAYSLEDNEPYIQGAAPYIDAAIDWARATGLKIWIDLHGAPLSQNGYDNSGHRISKPGWQQGDSIAQTLAVLNTITQKYAQPSYQDVVIGIELLNEPASYAGLDFNTLEQFYKDGYGQVRAVSDTPVILHDAFLQPDNWNNILSTKDNAYNVAIDHHEYQIFSTDLIALTPAQHVAQVCTNAHVYSGADKWVIVGEFTAAMTDCAWALNGLGVGSRYDGTYPNSTPVGSCQGLSDINTWSAQYKNEVKDYLHAQLGSFETHAQGWIFWNFKTESAHEWDALVLFDHGLWPDLRGPKFNMMC